MVYPVPRIIDLPYISSPPIQFSYQKTVSLAGGYYTWTAAPAILIPDRPIMVNSLYFFKSLTLSADLEDVDYTSNLYTTPVFQMYLKSRAKAILFREPIQMLMFMQNFEYQFAWFTQQDDDQLFASFNGSLVQGPGLVGKTSITLKALISAQEVVDEKFVNNFIKGYPAGGSNE